MFSVVFALFVVAMVVLVVLILRWAIKHDIDGRRAMRAEVSHPESEVDE